MELRGALRISKFQKSASMFDLLLLIGEVLLTVTCIAMAVVALGSVFEGWLL